MTNIEKLAEFAEAEAPELIPLSLDLIEYRHLWALLSDEGKADTGGYLQELGAHHD